MVFICFNRSLNSLVGYCVHVVVVVVVAVCRSLLICSVCFSAAALLSTTTPAKSLDTTGFLDI